jgi:nucleoside-diphosphate-sugar epimerase
MTILVTGASGFIGSFIAGHLAGQGHKVIVPTRSIDRCWRLEKRKEISVIEGDLRDYAFAEGLYQRHRPEAVVHTAWEGMTRDKREDPTQINNLIVMESLLRLTGAYGCSLFIGFGSQAEYGVYNKEVDEEALTKPQDLYGIYKLSAGHLGQWYARKYGFNYAWLRLFSSFGPKDTENYIIPYAIRSFLMQEAPRLSACDQHWDYLYVKDIARMVAKVIEKQGKFNDMYNLSSGHAYRLRDVIEMVKDLTRSKIEPQFGALPQSANGLTYLKGSNRKFQETFGHETLTGISQALQETVEWYREYLSRSSIGKS